MYLVRGCDAFSVSLGACTVGKELYHSLRATSTQGRPQLRAMQFPVNISNRIAHGLASMSLGGKDLRVIQDHCLSAADFPLTGEKEFDGWGGSSDQKLERRPKMPHTLNAWYRNALREAWAVACVYGTEHYSAFEQAATYLLKLGEEHAYMWPAHSIMSVWEELRGRFVEEMRDLDRNLRRAMKEDSPTFERMRFFATAPGDDGEPWLRLPRIFYLEDGQEYFQTDVLPRHNRLLSRTCWQVALKRAPQVNLQGGKAGEGPEASISRPGPKAGKSVEAPPTKPLLGTVLTSKEAARALDHRPKDKKGIRYLCWDYLTHRGCNRPSTCPHSHAAAPKWETIDWSVQLQLLRRGGLKGSPSLTEAQVSEQMEAIRQAQVTKNKEMMNEGKKTKKVGEQQPGEAKVGQLGDQEATPQSARGHSLPPEEFTEVHPTDQESAMVNLLNGPDFSFYEDEDRGMAMRTASTQLSKFVEEASSRKSLMGEVDQAKLADGYGGLLGTYLKNGLLQLKKSDPRRALSTTDVRGILEEARAKGGPELSTAADEALQGASAQRAGYSANVGHLTKTIWAEGVGHASLSWKGGTWDVYDFGDQLLPQGSWPETLLSKRADEEAPEIRQCLLLHCAAGLVMKRQERLPTLPEVHRVANELRAELTAQAAEASRHLGDCSETMPRSEADLRVFVHDLLHWSHDKDYRTLAAFPSDQLLGYDLHVVRMAADGDLTTEMITGVLSPGKEAQAIYLLVHQGHMRLLAPKDLRHSPPLLGRWWQQAGNAIWRQRLVPRRWFAPGTICSVHDAHRLTISQDAPDKGAHQQFSDCTSTAIIWTAELALGHRGLLNSKIYPPRPNGLIRNSLIGLALKLRCSGKPRNKA